MQHKKVKTVSKVPVLGDIPLLGFFFRSTSDTVETTNLIIVVRAQIVTPSGQTYYDLEDLRASSHRRPSPGRPERAARRHSRGRSQAYQRRVPQGDHCPARHPGSDCRPTARNEHRSEVGCARTGCGRKKRSGRGTNPHPVVFVAAEVGVGADCHRN